jgi:thiol:disulfide interchange protein DsbD
MFLSASPVLAEEAFLPPEQAFKFSTRMEGEEAVVRYEVAPGYYMYRERFAFEARGATLGTPKLPPGTVVYDETFQKNVESYRGNLTIRVPVTGSGTFTLVVTSQGCSDKGLCYSPMTSTAALDASGAAGSLTAPAAGVTGAAVGRIEKALFSRDLALILPMFLLLGLGLAFTPCVLPMLPILSSIIVGSGVQGSRMRGFALSASYSLGMALVYTLMGIAAGLAGQGLAAALQTPWVLGGFALLMVLLSLSMFGVYELQMPAAIQTRLMGKSNDRSAGTHAGVFAMGALSALIVGPCVAAPLAGALVYISQTRDAFIGGSALFSMATGMSIPLLLLGASAGALLPRAGAWMDGIKKFFGVLMLGTALWIASPFIPPRYQMLGWALLGLGYAVWLLSKYRHPINVAVGVLAGALGAVQLAGLAYGGADPLSPFTHPAQVHGAATAFKRVHTVEELDAALAAAGGAPVMLDFYADWCVSCKEMERFTFSDARVRSQLDKLILLQADVTANSAADQALLKRFGLFGPPGIVFFGAAGREIAGTRVIGYQDADEFLHSLAAVTGPAT